MAAAKCNVLIAEDNEHLRTLVKVLLENEGCTVLEARDGKEAIEQAREQSPNLILIDLSMPVLNGFEATRRLREIPETRSLPIVGLSSLCDGWHEEAIAAGCDDCILKPIDQKALRDILERFLHSEA